MSTANVRPASSPTNSPWHLVGLPPIDDGSEGGAQTASDAAAPYGTFGAAPADPTQPLDHAETDVEDEQDQEEEHAGEEERGQNEEPAIDSAVTEGDGEAPAQATEDEENAENLTGEGEERAVEPPGNQAPPAANPSATVSSQAPCIPAASSKAQGAAPQGNGNGRQ